MLGHIFGFLQSAEGAIALILCFAVVVVAVLTVHFVNGIRVWRNMAAAALKRSGELLSSTQNDDLGAIADVIGIAIKDPHDKKDIARKDKKLHWFLRTGTLPKRPYSDDLQEDENLPANTHVFMQPPVERYVKEPYEKVRYEYTYTAKLIGLPPEQKERYSRIKNELLGYEGVRARIGKRKERFSVGRKTVATLCVRGKTLRLQLVAAAEQSETAPAASEKNGFTEWRLTSERRVRYAERDIARTMQALSVKKSDAYTPQDFYMPYEGVVSLMQCGLVKRKPRVGEKIFRIQEAGVVDPPQ